MILGRLVADPRPSRPRATLAALGVARPPAARRPDAAGGPTATAPITAASAPTCTSRPAPGRTRSSSRSTAARGRRATARSSCAGSPATSLAAATRSWNIEYRRIGRGQGGGWPATFLDVAAAIDHLASVARAARPRAGDVLRPLRRRPARAVGGGPRPAARAARPAPRRGRAGRGGLGGRRQRPRADLPRGSARRRRRADGRRARRAARALRGRRPDRARAAAAAGAARARHRRRDGLGAAQPQLRRGRARRAAATSSSSRSPAPAGSHRSHVDPASASWAAITRWLARRTGAAAVARRRPRRPATRSERSRRRSGGRHQQLGPLVAAGLVDAAGSPASATMRSAGKRHAQRLRGGARRAPARATPRSALGPGEDHRHAVVDRRATTAFAAVVRIVADSIGSPSSVPGVHSPAKANGAPSASVKRNGTRGWRRSSGRSHS